MSTDFINEAEEYTDKFITEMIIETGCSIKFLNEARPSILRLFSDTTGEARDNGLVVIRKIIENQAIIERCCSKAISSLKKRDTLSAHFSSSLVTRTV